MIALILALALTGNTPDPDQTRANYHQRASRAGYTITQWRCLDEIIRRESGWRAGAVSATGKHGGLFQLRGLSPATNLDKQWKRGTEYIRERYGTPCRALAFHRQHGWY